MPDSDLETRARLEHLVATRYRLDRELGRGGMATFWLAARSSRG